MKWDKELVLAAICCAVLLFGWTPFCRLMGWMPSEVPPPAASRAPQAAAPAAAPVSAVPATVPCPAASAATSAATSAAQLAAVPKQVLQNQSLALSIFPAAGAVESIRLKDFLTNDRKAELVIDQAVSGKRGGLPLQAGALGVQTPGQPFETVEIIDNLRTDDRHYQLVRRVRVPGGELIVTQRWTLEADGYRTNYELSLHNPGTAALVLPRLVVSDGELQQWGALSGDKMRSDATRLDYLTANGGFEDIAADAKDSKFFRPDAGALAWVALSNKYFITILRGKQPFLLYQSRTRLLDDPEKYLVNAGAEYRDVTVPAQGAVGYSFELYSGPKVVAALDAFAPSAGRTMHLAWGPLDYLARFMLWALVHLKGLCGSYGWSIVLLTVIVRLLFWPITARANNSMKKMSALQPKIKELREKYKDNPQMLNTKTMELYRTEKINPLGGCLPILLQIPVFFALYATLDGAVELRQVAFLWSHDLAAADTVARLFGLPINPLVIAMTLLMVLQQRLTPSAMDPMQQKMMLAMPVVMLFFLYDLPSGLTLYWTVSQVFSILQLLIQKRYTQNPTTPAAATKKA